MATSVAFFVSVIKAALGDLLNVNLQGLLTALIGDTGIPASEQY